MIDFQNIFNALMHIYLLLSVMYLKDKVRKLERKVGCSDEVDKR